MDEDTQADAWSQLSEDERALILQRLKGKGDLRGKGEITQRPDPDSAPLSYSQEQLWFLDQFEPSVTAYNRPWALRIHGSLKILALEKSLNEIVRRHEALRTNFVSSAGKPSQRIIPFYEFTLPLTDLSEEQEGEKETIASQIARDDAFKPFDLTRDSMFKPRLIRLSSEDHVLLLTTHHIAFDGWSERVMYRELCELYQGFLTDTSPNLPKPDIQFPDFAHWQRETLTGDNYDRLSAFWKNELDGTPPFLQLFTDYDRPQSRSYAGDSLNLQLSKEVSESLKGTCRQEDVTLFMALLAAYKVVLFHNSGESDIVVGGTISGRNNPHLEKVIGFFVNTLVLRSKLETDQTFRELLGSVRETTLRALSHQDLPFEKLVEILNPPRNLSYTPVVQATLQLRNLPDRGDGIPGLEIEEFDIGFERALFDLSLSIEDLTDGLFCKLLYNRALFSKDTAQRMLRHFQEVIHAVIADPETPISRLRWFDTRTHPERMIIKPIVDPEIQEKSNLTGTQLMVWAGQKFRPDSLLYNLPYTFTINGHIDLDKFQESFQYVINKTDSLRTIIIEEGGVPQRSTLKNVPAYLKYVDFSDNVDPLSATMEWIQKESRREFSLTERLFETALIQLGDDHWVWFFHVHHLIVDNISVQLIFDRLQEIYQVILENEGAWGITYPQYEDFVSFEKKNRLTPQYQAARSYWTEKLSSPSEPLRFFGDRKNKETTLIERCTFELDQETCQKLTTLAESDPFFIKNVDVTLSNIFASLVYAFLYRITQSRDLSIGIHFHNRHTPQFRQTIGLLMEVLPLQISIDDGEAFSTLIMKVNREASEILQHRNFAIGNPLHHQIYEVTLNFQTVKVDSFLGFPTEIMRVHNGHEEDSLGIQIRDYGSSGTFTMDFDFHKDLFSEIDQQRSKEYFLRILNAMLANPFQQLDDINILSDRERDFLVYEFNNTKTIYSDDITVMQLFEKQVDENPDGIAVLQEGQSQTYRQLNSRANQVAHKLHKLGLKPDDPVALFVERSAEMIIGILGILKAGCAYLPIDPNHPTDRLNYILEDSGVSAVLTQRSLRNRLPSKNAKHLIVDDWNHFIREDESNPIARAGPRNGAYLIYTSGSTGVPKGVMIEHQSLVNFTEWAGEDWEISSADRVLQFTSISWDAHIEEIFPSLCSGATLILRPDTMIDTFQSFMETIRREKISVIDLPTAYWHELADAVEYQELSIPSSLRLVIIGGEPAGSSRVASWLDNVNAEVRLVNTYGLTECTSIATQIDLTKEFDPHREVVSIGKPINNARVYVLDQSMNPVPIGMQGEIWIGGTGLARGYVNKQDLTDEVFSLNPFTGSQTDRIYRSGDCARVLPDGNLEMLGRVDNQVKIRGYRIELGEIEVVLGMHPAIDEVVVVAREDDWNAGTHREGEKCLIAYYLIDPNFSMEDASEVFRNFLRDKLPDYMIPTFFIKLETFPLTPHGKVDRQALSQPDKSEIEVAHAYVAPRTSLESQLVEIWQQVLGIQPIGVTDNFFDLGGHSLMAVRLFSLIEKEIGLKLPLMTLFDAPTIANQAKSLQSSEGRADSTWIVDVQAAGSRPPFFCVSPSVIDVITYRELSRNMGNDQPFYALYSESMGLWREGVEHLETIAAQFTQKIREIDQDGPYLIGGYSAGGVVALEIAKQLRNQGYQVGLLILFDTFGPDYPKLLPGISPGIFNALLVVRRIQSYFWKFKLLDWKGKIQYLRFPRIQTWVRDRYSEVKAPPQPPAKKGAYYLSPARKEYQPGDYDGKVLLIRARKSLLGIRRDPMMGWGDIFSGDFDVGMVPGDHEAILFGPRSNFVAKKLISYIRSSFPSDREDQ